MIAIGPLAATLGIVMVLAGVRSEPDPLRVLVALDLEGTWWRGSKPAAVLTDRLGARLETLGFEPVRGGDPWATTVLERSGSPEDAARALRAAFVLTAKLVPETHQHPIEGGFCEVRVAAPLVLHHLSERPTEAGALESWSGAKTHDEAMQLLATSLADQALDGAVSALLSHPVIQKHLRSSDVAAASKLARARNYVRLRSQKLAEAKDLYDLLERRRVQQSENVQTITYYGLPAAQDSLVGVGPLGMLVRSSDVRPFFSLDTFDMQWISLLDTLEWRGFRGQKTVLWRGYSLFGYPSVAPEGAPVVLVEDLFGWAKTIAVVDASGVLRRLRIDSSRRLISPRVAPGGKWVAFYDRECRKCPSGFHVLGLDDGKDVFHGRAKQGVYNGYAWIDANRVAVAIRRRGLEEAGTHDSLENPGAMDDPAIGLFAGDEPMLTEGDGAEPQTLFVVDAAERVVKLREQLILPKGRTFTLSAASGDGRRLALQVAGNQRETLALIDMRERKLKTFDVGGEVKWPAFCSNGKAVVFGVNGDIAWLDIEAATIRRLTSTPFEERYPRCSVDGTLVYFESLADDPNFPGRRMASVVASVPAPP